MATFSPDLALFSVCSILSAIASAREMPSNPQAYDRALKAIRQSREAVETLIDNTPKGDLYRLEILGPILSELRTAETAISRLGELRTN